MVWNKITESVPPEDKPVLFKERFADAYHVGFWDTEDNCMCEYSPRTGKEGWKRMVEKWTMIEQQSVQYDRNEIIKWKKMK